MQYVGLYLYKERLSSLVTVEKEKAMEKVKFYNKWEDFFHFFKNIDIVYVVR